MGRVPGRERGGPHACPRGRVSLGVGLGARREAMQVDGGAGAARSWACLGRRGLGRRSDTRRVRARRPVSRERRWRRHGAPLGVRAAAHAASQGTAAGNRDGGSVRLLAGPLPAHHEVVARRCALSLTARAHGRVAGGGRDGGSRAAHRWWNIKAIRGWGR